MITKNSNLLDKELIEEHVPVVKPNTNLTTQNNNTSIQLMNQLKIKSLANLNTKLNNNQVNIVEKLSKPTTELNEHTGNYNQTYKNYFILKNYKK